MVRTYAVQLVPVVFFLVEAILSYCIRPTMQWSLDGFKLMACLTGAALLNGVSMLLNWYSWIPLGWLLSLLLNGIGGFICLLASILGAAIIYTRVRRSRPEQAVGAEKVWEMVFLALAGFAAVLVYGGNVFSLFAAV